MRSIDPERENQFKAGLSVAVLLALLFAQVFFAMRTKSPTSDELAHQVASGYSHLVTGDFRMNPAVPPLSRLLSALPLYFLGAKAPLDHVSWQAGNSPEFARQFFYQANHNQDQLIFWARMPILLLSLVFGYFVFVWAHELFGISGGLSALLLYVFCPDVLAHSGLATSDIAVALFFYLAVWRFWKYLQKPRIKNLILTGVMTGLALISKFSAVLLFPTFLAIALISGAGKKINAGRMIAFLAVCFLTVWAGYFFEVKPILKNTPDPQKKIEFLNRIGGERLVRFASDVPVPLATFENAFGSMLFTRSKGTNAYLMGEWSHGQKGWWHYYFIAFGIKNTIPTLILIFCAFFYLHAVLPERLAKICLLAPIVLFFALTLRDKAQAGIRYFLPIYPLFFILAGGFAAWALKRNKLSRALVLALLSWHAVEAVLIYPDYLTYFNELIGGPSQGYHYLRDSNIDWGQDLKGLGEYAQKEGYPEVTLFYYGSADPAYYHIPVRKIEKDEFIKPRNTVYALAVHHIDSVRWFEKYKPVKIIGHSIFVYDFRNKVPGEPADS